jgi:L-2-hydroxyglutarate oxidase LhgO
MIMPRPYDLDVVVIGAGVVGLAIARALALQGRDVVVLEAEPTIGSHTSSRNSEVIHAGIYYPPGSLKARLCVEGKTALAAYCAQHDVPWAKLGKLIVAVTPEEVPALETYRARAAANGVSDLVLLDRAQARRLEPEVRCEAALLSPSTGIIDSHALMRSLRADLERAGGRIVLSSPVLGVRNDRGLRVQVGGTTPVTARCQLLVNSAGLQAPDLAARIEGLDPQLLPAHHLSKGQYFVLATASPFSRLIYPLPVPGGLGIHVTLDLAGRARFGPDVTPVDRIEYAFDEESAPRFYQAIRRYFPGLRDGALTPGYTGIRPKLGSPGTWHDFVIQGPDVHHVPGLVNLLGIESPGLTASLAIGAYVARLAAP